VVLIIFGIRRRGHRMANVFAMCGVCHSPAAQGLIRVKTFFTLFFIPLIPLGSKYRSVCTMCGATTSLSKEQADHAMATAQHQRAEATSPSAQAQSVPAAGTPLQGAVADTTPPPLDGSQEAGNPPVD
jgi:hypothetical protein